MPVVVVVGLGPGDDSLVTPATLETIASTTPRFLRTARHPSAHLVAEATSFDEVYEKADTFDEVYRTIGERLASEAHSHGRILYAVPGSPLVLERTVAHLRARTDIETRIHPAISFLDEAWRALGIDPVEHGVRLVDGHEFAVSAAGHSGAMLVAHTHANWVLSDIKLSIEDPDPNTTVIVLHHLGLPDEQVVTTTWSDMDRVVEADHLTSLFIPSLGVPVGAELVAFHSLSRTLRERCPWDQEQTHQSLVRYLLEETYELVDAIERLDPEDPGSDADFIEELGDVLYQVAFHAAIAEEQGRFTIADVARDVHDKLVARHPHVFGDLDATTAAEVEATWDAIKKTEKPSRKAIFDGVVAASPSLLLATKTQQRAAKAGFDWPDHSGPLDKVREELDEVMAAISTGDTDALHGEIGDLLFAVVNVARHLDIEPESALRSAVGKFRSRVEAVERLVLEQGAKMDQMTLSELDELWKVVKEHPTH